MVAWTSAKVAMKRLAVRVGAKHLKCYISNCALTEKKHGYTMYINCQNWWDDGVFNPRNADVRTIVDSIVAASIVVLNLDDVLEDQWALQSTSR